MLLLVLTNLTAYIHSLGQQVHQLVVNLINLLTHLCDTFRCDIFVADDQQRQDIVEHLWCHLLTGIAPRLIRIAMTLHNQTVESQVHRLLTEWSNELASSSDMRRIADDRQIGYSTVQFDRYLPHRSITVYLIIERGESSMDGSQSFDARLVQSLHRSYPQFEVRVHWVFDEHRDVDTSQ